MSDPTTPPHDPNIIAAAQQAEMNAYYQGRAHVVRSLADGLLQGLGPAEAYDVAAIIVETLSEKVRAKDGAPPAVVMALRMASIMHAAATEQVAAVREQSTSPLVIVPAGARLNGKPIR